jgi:hypothetical protein
MDFPVGRSLGDSIHTCHIPRGEQWCLNWRRMEPSPRYMGYSCGEVLVVHGE